MAVKTGFVYFPVKEDLVFHGEDEVLGTLVDRIRDRPAGRTPLDVVVAMLKITMSAGPSARSDDRASSSETRNIRGEHCLPRP